MIIRMLFIEIHDKLTLILIVFLYYILSKEINGLLLPLKTAQKNQKLTNKVDLVMKIHQATNKGIFWMIRAK